MQFKKLDADPDMHLDPDSEKQLDPDREKQLDPDREKQLDPDSQKKETGYTALNVNCKTILITLLTFTEI